MAKKEEEKIIKEESVEEVKKTEVTKKPKVDNKDRVIHLSKFLVSTDGEKYDKGQVAILQKFKREMHTTKEWLDIIGKEFSRRLS